MKFGAVPIADAEGLILAHRTVAGEVTFKKGHALSAEDITILADAGVRRVTGALLEEGDVAEDDAALILAECVHGVGLRLSEAHTGRCNVVAAQDGVVLINRERITRANMVSADITVATVPPTAAVASGQIAATIKIIPFAVAQSDLQTVLTLLTEDDFPALSLAGYEPLHFGLISTTLPHLKASVVEKTEAITRARVAEVNGQTVFTSDAPHSTADVRESIKAALVAGSEVILIAAASATVDREDEVPRAIKEAGGRLIHFGMPVDPGNLLLLAEIEGRPVIVLPGCARSPKLNGLDWVLQRLAAGISVEPEDIMQMGVGGLLVDTPQRPLPRAQAVAPHPAEDTIGGVLLAAGQSRRMGDANKLLQDVGGKPVVRHLAEELLAAQVSPLVVVTGHNPQDVTDALSDLDVTFVHNPSFAEGLSTSIQAGTAALPETCAGAIVCQSDMPTLTRTQFTTLMVAFAPEDGDAICVPVHQGKRGNPVLWARSFFAQFGGLAGDVGAKHLIGQNEALVKEVEFDDTSILKDLDTPEQWAAFRAEGGSD